MYEGKKTSLLQWEKVLKVMLDGKPINKEYLETLPEMKGVPMYRLSSFIYHVKLAGGVVKVLKNGRKIDMYELKNISDMQKYMDKRECVFEDKVKKTSGKLKKLSDLTNQKIEDTVQDETVANEIVNEVVA